MTDRIADFTNPPLQEVSLGVVFQDLSIPNYLINQTASVFLDEFPRIEEHKELESELEDLTGMPIPKLRFRTAQIPSIRYWYLSRDNQQLIQIQKNRFNLNWRRGTDFSTYPKYPNTKVMFQECFDTFCKSLSEVTGLSPIVEQVEISYINHIIRDADTAKVFTRFSPGGKFDEFAFSYSSIRQLAGSEIPNSRMAVSVFPAILNETNEPIFVFENTVRMRQNATAAEIDLFFDEARRMIVEEFLESTTSFAQERWGLHEN